jgi:glycosyltransferase XagB
MLAGAMVEAVSAGRAALADSEPICAPDPQMPGHEGATSGGERARLDEAVNHLERWRPELSARTGLWAGQRAALTLASLGFVLAIAAAPTTITPVMAGLFALVFALLLALRLLAIRHALVRQPLPAPAAMPPAPDEAALPVYTVLIALHDEAAVAPGLVAALVRLDYPPCRLDVIFALETGDLATRNALQGAALPAHMRIVTVPPGLPRTKPRALCYALTFARGEYVVIYDAEDEPDPGQLRAALAIFQAAPADLGCLQARLAIHNGAETWLTAQFAIEYAALFGAIVPALAAAGLPVPLGGTSNHFPRRVLDAAGAWDPYNVTEDADLGIRLARAGWRVEALACDTGEEAPPDWGSWLGQRTRWQKGWLQTYTVHMRDPVRLWCDLGPWRWLWFHIVFGGGLLSAFAHPWFYLWVAWHWVAGTLAPPVSGGLQALLWWTALATMAAAYLATIILAWMTLPAAGQRRLRPAALLAPFYWLPVSLAAYCALWQWLRAPHYWAKTPHRARPAQPPVGASHEITS